MALVARISDVGHEQTIENEDGSTSVRDLSLSGRYYVKAVYVDSQAPDTILLEQVFEFPQHTSVEEAQSTIVSFGQRVRDARVRVGELQAYVGATIPLT